MAVYTLVMDDKIKNVRPRPIRETTARLIYQNWSHAMCDIGRGHEVFDWHMMPGDVRRTFEDAVSSVVNYELMGLLQHMTDRMGVGRVVERT